MTGSTERTPRNLAAMPRKRALPHKTACELAHTHVRKELIADVRRNPEFQDGVEDRQRETECPAELSAFPRRKFDANHSRQGPRYHFKQQHGKPSPSSSSSSNIARSLCRFGFARNVARFDSIASKKPRSQSPLLQRHFGVSHIDHFSLLVDEFHVPARVVEHRRQRLGPIGDGVGVGGH